MADSADTQANSSSQQVTSKLPTTKPAKNPRVAAGKAIAERMRLAREVQKEAASEAAVIISNNKAKEAPSSSSQPLFVKQTRPQILSVKTQEMFTPPAKA